MSSLYSPLVIRQNYNALNQKNLFSMNKSTWRNTSCVNKNIIAPNITPLNMSLLVGDSGLARYYTFSYYSKSVTVAQFLISIII